MSNDDPVHIAIIKARLEELGRDRAWPEREADLKPKYLGNVLGGRKTIPNVEISIRIARALHMDLHSLFEGKKDIQLGVTITGAARGEGGMWQVVNTGRETTVPLEIFGDGVVRIVIDDSSLEPVYSRGDVVIGAKTTGAHLHNLVGRDCIIQAVDDARLIGHLERATTGNRFTVRAVGSRERSPSSDVLIDWAAPIQVVLKKAV